MKANLGTFPLSVKLLTIPEKRGMISIHPAINQVQYIVDTGKTKIIIYAINFDDKKEARKWYEEVKRHFEV